MLRGGYLVSTVIAMLAATAAAQPSSPAPHVRRGLFVRGQIGVATVNTKWNQGLYERSLRGSGETFSIAAGAALSPRWSLHAEAFDLTARDLRLRISLSGPSPALTEFAHKYALLGLGVGATHYFGGHDTYVSFTVAASMLRVTNERIDVRDTYIKRNSDLGGAVAFQLGHDWWLSTHASLGVSGRLVFARVTDDPSDDTPSFQPAGFALTLSGAYH